MEPQGTCCTAPLNPCCALSFGAELSLHDAEDELEELAAVVPEDCDVCKLDELFGEGWD